MRRVKLKRIYIYATRLTGRELGRYRIARIALFNSYAERRHKCVCVYIWVGEKREQEGGREEAKREEWSEIRNASGGGRKKRK